MKTLMQRRLKARDVRERMLKDVGSCNNCPRRAAFFCGEHRLILCSEHAASHWIATHKKTP